MRHTSLVLSIKLALAGIVGLAALTMMASYWLSDRADNDAYAINLAGSLRMQTYRTALLAEELGPEAALDRTRDAIEPIWEDPVFADLTDSEPAIARAFAEARQGWRELSPRIGQAPYSELQPELEAQVERLHALVGQIQSHAETNAQRLRLVQVVSLLAILVLATIVAYWLNRRLAQPLEELGRVTRQVAKGEYAHRIEPAHRDELGSVAESFNHMSRALARMHGQMQEQIEHQTLELQRSNTTLEFLYQTAQAIIEQEPGNLAYEPIITRAAELSGADDLELCLITETGDYPYRQIKPEDSDYDLCRNRSCEGCLNGELDTDAQGTGLTEPVYRYSFPMSRDQRHYGVLVCRMARGKTLAPWQQQLLQSVADQIAMALSLQAEEDNARRLSLAQERAVIARELHDSLAQALSYLKIQVARLNRALDKDDRKTLDDVSQELHEGLSSAYRQLRELLTTFRLKVDGPGLLGALQTSVSQLSEQTDMQIALDYQLESLPLTPNEEIHLLQIVREATQNAIHHSKGKQAGIHIRRDQNRVSVVIEDDGVGIGDDPEKLNHYGLAIMRERSTSLGGRLTIANRPEGGTRVAFAFSPSCLRQADVFAREA